MVDLRGGLLLDEHCVTFRTVFSFGQAFLLAGGGNRGKYRFGMLVSECRNFFLLDKFFAALCAADADGQAAFVIGWIDCGIDYDVSAVRTRRNKFNIVTRDKLQDRCRIANVDFAVPVNVAGKRCSGCADCYEGGAQDDKNHQRERFE